VEPQVNLYIHKTRHWTIRSYDNSLYVHSCSVSPFTIIPYLSLPKAFYRLQVIGLSFYSHFWILSSAFSRSVFQISSSFLWTPW